MANRLSLASERRKLALRATILNNRQRVAQLQEQTRRAREELSQYRTKRSGGSAVASLPIARVR